MLRAALVSLYAVGIGYVVLSRVITRDAATAAAFQEIALFSIGIIALLGLMASWIWLHSRAANRRRD